MTSAHRECLVPIAQLTDELMAATKGDQPNLLVGIGFPGSLVTFLNPANVADVINRFADLQHRPFGEDDHAKLLAFGDVFEAYDYSELA